MKNQVNALRKLDNILSEAINSGNKEQASGPILLKAMNLEEKPHNLTNFYDVLTRARNEAQSIRNKPNLDRYLKIIEELHGLFIVHHLWNTQWNTFSMHIESANILTALDALADNFDRQNPSVDLGRDSIEKIAHDFTDLLREVSESDLSQQLKNFLIEQLEIILTTIHQYDMNGSKDIERASKSFMSDLLIIEPSLTQKDKDNPIYKKVIGRNIGLALSLTTYIFSVYPDIQTFWMPQLNQLFTQCEQLAEDNSNIQIVVSQALSYFSKETPKILDGKEIKAMEPSKK